MATFPCRTSTRPARRFRFYTLLRADIGILDDYSAVVFAGANIDEYVFNGRGSVAAQGVMKRMVESNRVVAGIAVSETGVLANHGVASWQERGAQSPLVRTLPSEISTPFFDG